MSRNGCTPAALRRLARSDIMGDFSTQNARGVTFSELHAVTFADPFRRWIALGHRGLEGRRRGGYHYLYQSVRSFFGT